MNEDWDHFAVIRWLMRDGRMLNSRAAIIEGLGQRMLSCRAPVQRLRLSMRMLHPLLSAVSATWEADAGLKPTAQARHDLHADAL